MGRRRIGDSRYLSAVRADLEARDVFPPSYGYTMATCASAIVIRCDRSGEMPHELVFDFLPSLVDGWFGSCDVEARVRRNGQLVDTMTIVAAGSSAHLLAQLVERVARRELFI